LTQRRRETQRKKERERERERERGIRKDRPHEWENCSDAETQRRGEIRREAGASALS